MEQKSKQDIQVVYNLNYKHVKYNLGSEARVRKWINTWRERAQWKPPWNLRHLFQCAVLITSC